MTVKKMGLVKVPARYDAAGKMIAAERDEIGIVDEAGNAYAFVAITLAQADALRAALAPGAQVINTAAQLPARDQ